MDIIKVDSASIMNFLVWSKYGNIQALDDIGENDRYRYDFGRGGW